MTKIFVTNLVVFAVKSIIVLTCSYCVIDKVSEVYKRTKKELMDYESGIETFRNRDRDH